MRSRRPQEAAGTVNDVAITRSVDSSLEALGLDVLAAMLSTSQVGVFVLDSDYRILYANPAACELYCRPLQDLRGHDSLAFVAETDQQTVLTFWANLRPGRHQTVAGVRSRPDGSNLEVEVTGSVLNVHGREFRVGMVRDVTERQRQARQAAALAQAVSTVSGGDSIDAILEAICDCALAGTRALAAWVRLDDGDRTAAWIGAAGVPEGFGDCLRSAAAMPDARPITRQALAMGRVAVYADWRQQVERVFGVPVYLKDLPWQAAVLAPIWYQGEAVGMLTAIFQEGDLPNEAETTFLPVLADQAATAAANARLLAAAREKVLLEERQRLARELHDSVSQSLYAIQLGAQTARDRLEVDPAGVAQPIDSVVELVEASQAEMRALIFELRPEALDTEGLRAAVERHITVVGSRHGISTRLAAGPEPELPVEVKHALCGIAQEAIWNTVKHAHASRVDVSLQADDQSVVLEVADDGVGFDPGGSFPGHLGLRSMRERAIGAYGSLEVVSAPGRGTRIVVKVPARRDGDGPARTV